MKLADATNEREFIEAVRGVFRAYVPESDAWAKPNFFDVNATVTGGFFWSAVNEIRNGIDKRLNPQTAVGEHLDVLVSQPPLNLTRRGETHAYGAISVNLDIDEVPVGYIFETSNNKYRATEAVILTDGKGIVSVESLKGGADTNSPDNQPMTGANGTGQSLGIYGGFDVECDEQLRRRLFATKGKFHFFGSQCSMQDAIAGMAGVTRSWVIQDGLAVKMLVLMEDKYPCGQPQQSDFDDLKAYFEDECLANLYFCPVFEAPRVIIIAPEILWSNGQPSNICEVSSAMQVWLRNNYDLGDGVRAIEIQAWLSDTYPEYDPQLVCCDDYPPYCDAVYNCVELIGCGGPDE